ncbi:MAG TPA: methanogenesis marker 12 protein [Methanoregulaceae archaeon]|nr:MAG: methanogenesis marker 12 protein [Methanolinea sp.]HON81529.1 methanogenesis marker 12 protein [Methanoregulaceae archaeon]HPD10335.1 methanogenesis marker 12 protein [Methanoregulaceae archaeon]HRT15435.1 methanogenesis marker 12 protein [Methanoregulaceae archaeon]HRU30908.1 methanogenesis marker 12 protein [Methanoregulaceae archaeon]
MFIGIDHGTSAIRFSSGESCFKITREEAREFRWQSLARLCPLNRIEGIALTYSMGDAFATITRVQELDERGVISREGAGKHIGGGTCVFDQVRQSGLPAVAVPGLHRGSPTDVRFKAYSHQASPEKIGIAYLVSRDLGEDFVVSDASSNTVTVLVSGGRIIGALDACIFAPGLEHGALDVEAIRSIDAGKITANGAFLRAGVNHTLPPGERYRTVALFTAMECAALLLLAPSAGVAIAGSLAPCIAEEVESLLQKPVAVYDEWCASRGLCAIARDVFGGKKDILGIGVNL